MPDNVKDWETLKRYLLGTVSPAEQQDVERWLICDDRAYDQLEAAEDELIDTFLRGELRGRDLDQFNSHFLTAPERNRKLQFSRSLIRFLDGPLVQERPSSWVGRAVSRFRALAYPAGGPRPDYGGRADQDVTCYAASHATSFHIFLDLVNVAFRRLQTGPGLAM